MHKTAFIRRVAQKHKKEQISQRVYDQVLKELLAGIQQELAAGREVHFLGFGTFYTREAKGTLKDIRTKEPKSYAVRIPAFRPGDHLKKAVRKK